MIHFIVTLALLRWSGMEPAISLRYVCMDNQDQQEKTQGVLHLSTIPQTGEPMG